MSATIQDSPPKTTEPGDSLHRPGSGTYSVICDKGDHSRHVVATGLEWEAARAMADRLDREYRERVEATGKYYSTWGADLHECQLESPNK